MVFIIAEAGVNHNGDVLIAHKLIDAAKDAGADAVKFQTFDAEKLDPPGERRDMLSRCELSHDNFRTLKAHADAKEIEFMSSPFDVESLLFLVNDLQVRKIKIASGNLDNTPLLSSAARAHLPVILSTGMATIDEVREATHYFGFGTLTLLHCTSADPTALEDVNLLAMATLQEEFFMPVGLSDHSEHYEPAVSAVGMGASVIERHLTLDRGMDGPDHIASFNPGQFRSYVGKIRNAELCLGDGRKRPQPCEAPAMKIAAERKAWRELQCAS